MTTVGEKKFLSNNTLDFVTAEHPHMDDPRFLSLTNQMNHCLLRFNVFTRCARELGEEDTRCKYQYFRAQCTCPESQLEDWMEHRAAARATWTSSRTGAPCTAASEPAAGQPMPTREGHAA
eukprot:CAMPEP_0171195712 /NCGR_PEP_ID=MMETSP0790-20130122/21533_1 /TAXON_ID=2925 /ORGANISM="Alexandrium catenella, Strain OF101" /LENGTH=120 /DNA_ID=CAMNT_0011660923 /DNA_START=82 /DNA_END=445 /DNA_ORIENTATION=-